MEPHHFNFPEGETLLINKPISWTSFDVVNKLRYAIKGYLRETGNPQPKLKVGHAGTLDPLATGLLIVCTGKMTKRISEIQDAEKEYTGRMQFGGITASYDCELPVTDHKDCSFLTEELIREAAKKFTGTIMQMPPAYSALKIDGQAAYKSARKGEIPLLKAREVTIKEFEISDFDPNEASAGFRVVCSKGTYIRSLAHDLGQVLGCGAYLSALCRTRIGTFPLKEALEMEQFLDFIAKKAI